MFRSTFSFALVAGFIVLLVDAPCFGQGGTWTNLPSMPTGRFGAEPAVIGNRIFVIGGAINSCGRTGAVEAFDPATSTWATNFAPMPTARDNFGVAVAGNRAYAVGGSAGCGSILTTVESFDPSAGPGGTWSVGPPLPSPRHAHAVAAVNGVVYSIGGFNGSIMNSMLAYDTTQSPGTWVARAPMPVERYAHAAAAINGRIYLFGGGSNAGTVSAVDVYDPATNSWTTRSPMPIFMSWTAAVVVNDSIYLIGGAGTAGMAGLVEIYDPLNDTWTVASAVSPARMLVAAATSGGSIYAAGGDGGGPTFLNVFQRLSVVYPGTSDDLRLLSGIGANPLTGGIGREVKTALAGNTITVRTLSPGGTFNYKPLFLIAQGFPTGSPPTPVGPNIWLSLPGMTFLVGNVYNPLGTSLLLASGMTISTLVPPGLGGQSAIVQGIVVDPLAANGSYAATDAHEFRF